MPTFLDEASRVAKSFDLTKEDIQHATDHFVRQLTVGLEDSAARFTQIPSFVTQIPNGSEKGLYLAADLGGTNFRVCIVELHGNSSYELKQTKSAVPPALMVASTHESLFKFLANEIKQFVHSYDSAYASRRACSRERHLRLAFTFSFTVEQTSLHSGTLLRWDKGFRLPSAVGRDPCQMLQTELDSLGLPVLVSALANDTVGTYMAQQYKSGRAVVGAVFGTGTNGAYLEEMANITKLRSSSESTKFVQQDHMLINTEWGGLDDEARLLPTTQFDEDLDEFSLHPGQQRYEKLVSGMYLGEIFRRATLAARSASSPSAVSPLKADSPLHRQWHIPTSLLSVLANTQHQPERCHELALQNALDAESLLPEEVEGMRLIARAISSRAARFAGVAIAAVIVKTGALQTLASGPTPAKEAVMVSTRHKASTRWNWARHLLRIARSWWSFLSTVGLFWCSGRTNPSHLTHVYDSAIDVGLDGTLAASLPGFICGIRQTFRVVDGIGSEGDNRIRLTMVTDGSSVGTALVAQAAERQERIE